MNKHPNAHHWYMFMYTFSTDLMKKWIEKAAPKDKAAKGAKGGKK